MGKDDMQIVDPKIAILGYLPSLNLKEIDINKLDVAGIEKDVLQGILEQNLELNPQETIALASMMTYKDKNAAEMALRILSKEWNSEDKNAMMDKFRKKIKKSIIESAGRGHASLATSSYVGILMYGNSKFVDSMFTGAIFSSSLMPSGRRTGTGLSDIMVPKSIAENQEAKELYWNVVSEQIRLYEELQTQGVSKEEAAKITPYGIRGGGFMVVPLETILSFKQEFEIEQEYIPKEGHIFIQQIEKQLKNLGMDILYWSRYFSARNPYPYPNIFKNSEFDEKINSTRIVLSPNVLESRYIKNSILEKMLKEITDIKQIASDNKESIENWKLFLSVRRVLSRDFNMNFRIIIETFPSWRVWGEVKRHRTVRQTVESVYGALERSIKGFDDLRDDLLNENIDAVNMVKDLSPFYIIPDSVASNEDLLKKYLRSVVSAFDVYKKLCSSYKIPKSDAIYVVPRGIRLRVVKEYDLWNILDGYLPLRTCKTAEAEMYETSWKEFRIIEKKFPRLRDLLGPKCHAVGFCLENEENYKKCQKANLVNKEYDVETHNKFNVKRISDIEQKLK